jgi:hypothetical protein
MVVLTAGKEGKGGRSEAKSTWFQGPVCGGAWTHAPLVAVARGEDAPPRILQFQKSSPAIPGFFRVYFVIFELYNVLFWFILIFIIIL